MTLPQLREILQRILHPRCFVTRGEEIRIEHNPAERCAWEIVNGQLLPPSQSRQFQTFESWTISLGDARILSLRLDEPDRRLYVVRYIPIRHPDRWLHEWVATIHLDQAGEHHVITAIQRAIEGTSRLPITSMETPMPAFLLGRLAFFPHLDETIDDPLRLIAQAPDDKLRRARTVETILRRGDVDADVLAESISRHWLPAQFHAAIVTLFNHLALSPYTAMADRFVALLRTLGEIDLISYMLRHTVRHLTAFDLVRFHHLGANYPDALMLDAMLKAFLELLDEHPGRANAMHRRALRQAWITRKMYEGHPVPDAPTSPGENRWLIPDLQIIPPQQITDPAARRRRLYDSQPADELLSQRTRELLTRSIDELDEWMELRELGMAIYLDRPLGIFKPPDHPDRTPMLSYEAFSRSIALSRLRKLREWGWIDADRLVTLSQRVQQTEMPGVPVGSLSGHPRRGVVALEDAKRASLDFIFVRTTRSSLENLLRQYDFRPGEFLSQKHVLLIRAPRPPAPGSDQPLLIGYDSAMQPRIQLGLGQSEWGLVRYIEQAGEEFLEAGLRLLSHPDRPAPRARWSI